MTAPATPEERITLAHGNGGRHMRELIETVFLRALGTAAPDARLDAGFLPACEGRLMMTTDSFVVQPLEFPGGDIGALAVHGSFNDLAVSGAEPLALSLNVIIEEGLPIAQLERVARSLAEAAGRVPVCCADTKVVPRGEGGGLYLATTALGRLARAPALPALTMDAIRPGDCLLISGTVGDHGTAVMLAREAFGLSGELRSDAASVLPLTRALLNLPGLRFMRDPTRGGLASVCHEIAAATGLGVHLSQPAIPVSGPCQTVCEMLGFDPLYLACEGRVLAVVAERDADEALARWRALAPGRQAARIGRMTDARPHAPVILATELGGERILMELEDDPLPRIC